MRLELYCWNSCNKSFLPNRKQTALCGCNTIQEVFVSVATQHAKTLLPTFEPIDI